MAQRSRRSSRTATPKAAPLFSRRNYQFLALGVALVVLGFGIMRAENAVDGVLSLYVAPLLVLGGYAQVLYAILWRPRPAETPAPERV